MLYSKKDIERIDGILEGLKQKYNLNKGSFTISPQTKRSNHPTIGFISEIFNIGQQVTYGDEYFMVEYYGERYCDDCVEVCDGEASVVERIYF